MIALDTNVWVRYLTNDEPLQAERALRLLAEAGEVFVPKTVLLELEWVLRAVYAQPVAVVDKALRQILGLPNVRAEAPEQVAGALELYQAGFDFADALHLRCSGEVEAFFTFDQAFANLGRRHGEAILTP